MTCSGLANVLLGVALICGPRRDTDLLVDHTVIDPGYHRLPTGTITGAPPNYRCRGNPVGSARPANGWSRRTLGRLRLRPVEQLGPAFLLRIVRVLLSHRTRPPYGSARRLATTPSRSLIHISSNSSRPLPATDSASETIGDRFGRMPCSRRRRSSSGKEPKSVMSKAT